MTAVANTAAYFVTQRAYTNVWTCVATRPVSIRATAWPEFRLHTRIQSTPPVMTTFSGSYQTTDKMRSATQCRSSLNNTRQKHIQTRCLLFITDYKNKILSTEMTRLHTFSGPFLQLPGSPCSRQITMPAPHHSVLYRPDALPATKPTASKHWRH